MIYCYEKYITSEISRWMLLPDGSTELATVEGKTYCFVPDDSPLQEQPAEITDSIEPVVLTDALRDAIKAASPHARLINQRVAERIAARYSVTDEIKMLRIGGEDRATYEAYVEDCLALGRAQKAAIGL